MSELQSDDWEQFVNWQEDSSNVPEHQYDWSRGDLLDACYDPMLQGMGPGGSRQDPCLTNDFERATALSVVAMLGRGCPQSSTQEDTEDTTKLLHRICATCSEIIVDDDRGTWALRWKIREHTQESGCLFSACELPGCSQKFPSDEKRDLHQERPHIAGHGWIFTPTSNYCVECSQPFASKADLLRHAQEYQHQPYVCECGSSFSRLDVLHRHMSKFGTEDPKHPCKYCKRHRGSNGFRRLDHLMQHIRNYHHPELDNDPGNGPDTSRLKYSFPTCPHSDCSEFRDAMFKQQPRKVQEAGKPFASQADFTRHMKDSHNECTFPCDIVGCERIGRKGYFREKDLLKHRQAQHPEAGPYRVSKRDFKKRCTEEGCHAILDYSSMTSHMWLHNWKLRNVELPNIESGPVLANYSSSTCAE